MTVLNPFRPGTIHHIAIDASSAGDNVILAGVVGKRLMAIQYAIFAAGDVVAKFKSDDATDLTGPMSLAGERQFVSNHCDFGLLATEAGEDLILNLGAAIQVSGHITIQEIQEI